MNAIVALLLCCMPDRAMPPPDPWPCPHVPDPPRVACWTTSYGMMTQSGRRVALEGNSMWYANGEFMPDGTLRLTWILRETNQEAIGIYRVTHENGWIVLTGRWAFKAAIVVEADGSLSGLLGHDEIREYRE